MSNTPTDVPPVDWQSVRSEIIDDILRDRRKEEILKATEPKGWRSSLDTFLKHPAFLVFLTFVATTLVSTRITSSWQANQHKLDQKYAVIDQTNQVISEYVTAAQDIVGLYQQEKDAKNRDDLERERWTYWQQKSRDWRINSNTLPEKLKGRFRDPRISSTFTDISNKAYFLSLHIKQLKARIDGSSWDETASAALQEEYGKILTEVRLLKEKMAELLDLMDTEVKED